MNQLYDSDITGASCHCKTTDVLFFQSLHRQFSPVQVAWPVARAYAIWACTISGMGRRYSSFSLDLKRAFPCNNFPLVNEETNEHQQKAWSWPIVRSLTRQPCKENYHCLRSFCSIDCTHFQVSKYLLPSIHPATITVQAET